MTERGPGDGTVAKALSVMDEVAAFGRPVALLRAAGPLALPQGHALTASCRC